MGEKFTNTATITSDQLTDSYKATFAQTGVGGTAQGYVYQINIHKVDEQDQPLQGVVFDVIRVKTGKKVGEITTDADGNGSLGNLLEDDYTLVEQEASVPAGFQKAADTSVLASDFDKTTRTVTKKIVNKKLTPATAQLSAKKVLTGRTLAADEFEFVLKKQDGTEVQTVKNKADGSVTFDVLTFDQAGTYVYTISEKTGNAAGVTYDDSTITAVVTVTADGTGKLTAAVNYDGGNSTFTNTYTPASTTAQLSAKKVLNGRALAEHEFEFVLKNQDGTEIQTVKNQADGTVTFSPLTYTAAGTYTYTITEKAGTAGGVTYDSSTITATITVTDDGAGQLVASVSYDGANQTFTNTYTPAPATAQLKVKKSLTGRDFQDGEFEFTLTDTSGKVVETVKNKADGSVDFSALNFTQAGTYTYTIREVKGDAEGVTYDEKVITATVTVEDNSEGALTASVSYDKNGQSFENSYEPNKPNEATTPPSEGKKTILPRTGSASSLFLVVLGLVVGGFGFFLKKKRG